MAQADKADTLAIDGGSPVRTDPLPWELPGSHWIGEEELELVSRVIKARSPFRYYGPDPQRMVEQLEEAYRRRLGRKFALGVGSGTAALTIAMGALGVGPGDEVLVPGYLWVSCLSAIVRVGAIPKLVDIDDTFCMCPDDLERKISSRSRVVLLVHMSGACGRVDEIKKIAQDHGLRLVEDCAQANGGSFKGKPLGSFGDLAIFSFQLNKNMTSGEGGLVACNEEGLYKRCFALHDLGYARNPAGRLEIDDESCQLWGVGSRMSELSGAMALAQEGKLDRITGAMRTAKWAIRRQLEDIPALAFRNILDPEGDSGPFLIATLPDKEKCERFAEALRAEGIRGPEGSLAFLTMEEWGLHWHFNNRSLVRKTSASEDGWPWTHPANAFAEEYDYARGALPTCDDLASRSVLLTIASCLGEEEIDDIVTAFRKVSKQVLCASIS